MDLSVTAFQSRKTKISGAANSTRRARTVSSMAEVESERSAFLKEDCERVDTASPFGQKLAVESMTANCCVVV